MIININLNGKKYEKIININHAIIIRNDRL